MNEKISKLIVFEINNNSPFDEKWILIFFFCHMRYIIQISVMSKIMCYNSVMNVLMCNVLLYIVKFYNLHGCLRQ